MCSQDHEYRGMLLGPLPSVQATLWIPKPGYGQPLWALLEISSSKHTSEECPVKATSREWESNS